MHRMPLFVNPSLRPRTPSRSIAFEIVGVFSARNACTSDAETVPIPLILEVLTYIEDGAQRCRAGVASRSRVFSVWINESAGAAGPDRTMIVTFADMRPED